MKHIFNSSSYEKLKEIDRKTGEKGENKKRLVL